MNKTIAATFLSAILVASGSACKPRIPTIDAPFTDKFERVDIGPDWLDGKLHLVLAHNHPIWLRRKLPRNVQIDFDAVSQSLAGDLKVELYGDGESFDPDKGRYDPTSYMIVLGGWNNNRSIIGRLGEHDEAVKAARDREGAQPLVIPGRTYHFTVTRRGGRIDWKLDGAPYLSWDDPDPLAGSGHEFFAINDWEADVRFDNLTVRPLD